MDKMDDNLQQGFPLVGRENFTSFALAFIYFLNSVRLEHRAAGGLVHHNNYPSKLHEELLEHHRKVNISAKEFHAQMKNFYFNNSDNNIQIVTLGTEFVDLTIIRKNGRNIPLIDLGFNLNLLGPPRDYNTPPQITKVEVRMLMPTLKPFSINPENVQYNLSISQFNETRNSSSELFATSVWFPSNRNKWISFSSRALLKAAVDAKEWPADEWDLDFDDNPQNFQFRISGLPAKPLEAYMHVTLDDYFSVCEKGINEPEMRDKCKDYKEDDEMDCELLRMYQSRIDCCKHKIYFDSPDLDRFGIHVSSLAQDFHAPAGLRYSFCGEYEVWKQPEDCNPIRRIDKKVLTSDWLEPSKLVETNINNFEVEYCVCKSC